MNRLGLRSKLVLAITVPVLTIAAFFGWYFPRREEQSTERALTTRAASLTRVLANLVGPAVEFESEKDAQAQISSITADRDLLYVVVLKPDGSIFTRLRTARGAADRELVEPTRELRLEVRQGLLHVLAPLGKDDGTSLGSVVAGYSRDSIAAARRQSQKTALTVALGILGAGLVLAWFVSGGIAKPLLATSQDLAHLSTSLVAAARDEETAAGQGTAAVEQTRRTMETLVASAQQIADSCAAVLANAERAVAGSRHIADRINELNTTAEKVTELLATIMQVADRTDLLALNAALEGTKAGEAGKGFALVAAELRRLAENVMESVATIRRLLKDVRAASQAAAAASLEGVRLSDSTTESARGIVGTTQEQRRSTEQVRRSMDEMTQLLTHTVASMRNTSASAVSLLDLSARLLALVTPVGAAAGERSSRAVHGGGAGTEA